MRAICLSGGSNKGAYEVGVLKYLLGVMNRRYDLISGISVGSINGSFISMFPHGQEQECIQDLEKMWRNLTTKDIYKSWVDLPWPLHYLGYLAAPFKSSLYNSLPLENMIQHFLDRNAILKTGKKLHVGAVNLNTGEYKVFTETYPNLAQAVIASAAFPMAFKPVEIDGDFYLDGGIRQITPLKSVITSETTEIDVIMTSPKKELTKNYSKPPKLLGLGPRVIDIMSEEILSNDVDRFLEINNLIKQGAKIPGKRYIPINIYRPEDVLTKNSLEFEQKIIGPMIDLGFEQAKKMHNII